VEAPKSVEDMTETVAKLADRAPLMANMVEGGKTPSMNAADLEAVGFALVIFPGGAVRAIAATLEDYYSSLVANGTNEPFRNRMVDFSGINRIVGTPELLGEARRYDEEQH
jgi:2-methylisocitrate lyase-like PEP mutase family enzyme